MQKRIGERSRAALAARREVRGWLVQQGSKAWRRITLAVYAFAAAAGCPAALAAHIKYASVHCSSLDDRQFAAAVFSRNRSGTYRLSGVILVLLPPLAHHRCFVCAVQNMSQEEIKADSAHRSAVAKQLWQDPEYAAKTLSAVREAGKRRAAKNREKKAAAGEGVDGEGSSSESSSSRSESSSSRSSSSGSSKKRSSGSRASRAAGEGSSSEGQQPDKSEKKRQPSQKVRACSRTLFQYAGRLLRSHVWGACCAVHAFRSPNCKPAVLLPWPLLETRLYHPSAPC